MKRILPSTLLPIHLLASTLVTAAAVAAPPAAVATVPTGGLGQVGGWSRETVDPTPDTGWFPQIVASGSSDLHILYWVGTAGGGSGQLKYAKRSGSGSWATEVVAHSGSAALAVDSSGTPHVSLVGQSGGMNTVRHGVRVNGTWSFSDVDTGTVLQWTSIAVAPNGSVHISYRSGNTLKYATSATGSGGWTTTVVDAPPGKITGSYSSIALDSAGQPRISYYALTDRNLRYAELSGTGWVTSTADSSGTVNAGNTSLAIDASGQPHIQYAAGINGIKYTTRAMGGTFPATGELVDTGATTGSARTIALNPAGVPYLVYPSLNLEIKYAARRGPNSWAANVVDVDRGSVGGSVSLALRGVVPHIAYVFAPPSSLPIGTMRYTTYGRSQLQIALP